jgi:Family of unknown function (DUF6338)
VIGTFQAVAVFALFILPGAMYVWGMESVTGSWGLNWADRIPRFIGASVIIQAVISPLTYWAWVHYIKSGYFSEGKPFFFDLYIAVLAYALVPYLVGRFVGHGVANNRRWAQRLTGRRPGAPRAWDHLFQQTTGGWVVIKLIDGPFVGGIYASQQTGLSSYASAYPEVQELFLYAQISVDPQTGQFIDSQAQPLPPGQYPLIVERGLLVRWEQIEYLEFVG